MGGGGVEGGTTTTGDAIDLSATGATLANPANLNVNLTGVKTLTLIATNGVVNSIDYDHADWAGARLLASALQMPTAPSGLVATPASATSRSRACMRLS